MVLKSFTFIPDDLDLLNARPGSPHPFFYQISSASSSPDTRVRSVGSLSTDYATIVPIKKRRFPIVRPPSPPPDESCPTLESDEKRKENTSASQGSAVLNSLMIKLPVELSMNMSCLHNSGTNCIGVEKKKIQQDQGKKYTPAVDIWSIGCIFAELLTGKPLFPGKNAVHQLDLMTDLLGTPSLDTISRVRNEKARRYLASMRKKQPVPFKKKFPNADPLALRLLEKLLAFDPKDRPTAEEALAHPYFEGLAKVEREPSCQPITEMEFKFERRGVRMEDIRELIFREILEYHPQLLMDYINGAE
ncbi:hypothetical protein CDL15_Pgr001413 [Punica granatum]|uniref:Protein kinase domain-containing protein n=1 Tax=Punica granatum TaxID=22663 RepID=A0A218WLE6_PUNGR|nr:hypothetical protein CDL15_Pgr001413 [Punica granatum]